MFSKLKRKTLALNFFLIILVLSIGYSPDMRSGIDSASATSPAIVSQIRGDTYSDAGLSDGNHMWTGGLEPWMKASNGTYVPYILSQNSTHYFVDNQQAPFIINKNNCVTSIYDNSVPLSKNPASMISKEWWDVSYHTNTSPSFINMDLSSTTCTISVTTNSSGIFIDTLKAFPAGTLEVTYEKINGKPWETILTTTNMLSTSNYSIKPIERISGISADSIVVGTTSFNSTVVLSSQINQSSSVITINKGVKSFMFNENNALANFKQLNLTKTSSGFSLSTDFGNNVPVLSTNQKFTIDPTFGYASGTIALIEGTWTTGTTCSTTGLSVVSNYWQAYKPATTNNFTCSVNSVRWNISSIPTGSLISSATLQLTAATPQNPINCDYVQMIAHDPNSATGSQLWTDITTGTAYVSNDITCKSSGSGLNVILGSTANTDVHNQLSVGWFATGLRFNSMVRDSLSHTASSKNFVSSDFTLQIVYHPPPPQVTGLTTPTQSTSTINLRWPSSTSATWYLVDRESPTGGGFSQIANVTTLTYSNTGLTAGTQYNYKIFAGNSSGTSPASAPSSNYTKPVAPTGLTTPTQSTTGIIPRWSSVTSATWYLVDRESPTGGGFSQIANVTTLTYNNTGLVADRQYNYEIFAGNSGGIGSASAPSFNYTNPGVISINNDMTIAHRIIGVSGNTTVTTSGGTTTITLGGNAVTTNGAAQTISKQMTFNSTVNVGGNLTSTAPSGKTFKISAPPGVDICIGAGC